MLTEGGRPKPFPCFSLIHESPRRAPGCGSWPYSQAVLDTVYRDPVSVSCTLHPATSYMMHHLQPIQNEDDNSKSQTTDSWIRLGKLGSGGSHRFPVAVHSVMDQEARTSGPKGGKYGTKKNIPLWPLIKALAYLISYHL